MLSRRLAMAGPVSGALSGVVRRADAACAAPLGSAALEAGGPCVVAVVLGGQPARMVLDTGAERTVLSRDAVARLGIALDPWVGTTLRGAGGRLDQHQNAQLRQLSLGGVALFQKNPAAPMSLPVAALALGEVAGLLGGDVLGRLTLDIDRRAERMVLTEGPACGFPVTVPLAVLRRFLLLAPVLIDGVALTALLDTGAGRTLINARGMYRLGLSPERIAADPAIVSAGIGGGFTARAHRFAALTLGGRRFAGPELLLAAVPEPAFDLVLGMDVLGRQRFAVSYPGRALSLA